MKLLLYSKIQEHNIQDYLGLPEYSYYFVFKEFYRVLDKYMDVRVLKDISEANSHCDSAAEDCRLIIFSPPHKAPPKPNCLTYIMFAWEFDNLPDGLWSEDKRQSWKYSLQCFDGAITLSKHTEAVVKNELGESYKVMAIPVPVWDKFHGLRKGNKDLVVTNNNDLSLSVRGSIIDSRNYQISPDELFLKSVENGFSFPVWDGSDLEMPMSIESDIEMSVSIEEQYNSYLIGFYAPESWGVWSKNVSPSFLLPFRIKGKFQIEILCVGYNAAAHQEITLSIGTQSAPLQLTPEFSVVTAEFDIEDYASLLSFEGIDNQPVDGGADPRSVGFGVKKISIKRQGYNPVDIEDIELPDVKVNISGIIYTSVLNPLDERKCWGEILTAFCFAFRDNPDAVLILKMTHNLLSTFLGKLHCYFQQMSPFKCRVIAIHGFLKDDSYQQLIESSHYYINSSSAEGLCLPLMEYMSCGKPAITPRHTAMTDYVTDVNSFVLESALEPTHWPPDPDRRFTATQHRVPWYSLKNTIEESYKVITVDREKYNEMSKYSIAALEKFSSDAVILTKVREFLRS